jgi:hypothetical protein
MAHGRTYRDLFFLSSKEMCVEAVDYTEREWLLNVFYEAGLIWYRVQ